MTIIDNHRTLLNRLPDDRYEALDLLARATAELVHRMGLPPQKVHEEFMRHAEERAKPKRRSRR